MRKTVEKLLGRYGRDIRVQSGGKTLTVRGMLQPVTGRGTNMARISVGPLGREADGQYVYIGPVEPAVAQGDILALDGREFLLRRVEKTEAVYCWGICVEKGAEDTWGLNG